MNKILERYIKAKGKSPSGAMTALRTYHAEEIENCWDEKKEDYVLTDKLSSLCEDIQEELVCASFLRDFTKFDYGELGERGKNKKLKNFFRRLSSQSIEEVKRFASSRNL